MSYTMNPETQRRRGSNPILTGMSPDPSALVTEEGVWLVNSSFEFVPGLPISFSTDLVDWRHAGYAIDEEIGRRLYLDTVRDSGGVYAPTLRRISGRYMIACTICGINEAAALSRGADPDDLERMRRAGGNFIITAESMEGPWEGPFWVEGADGIDPDVFQDDDGSVWWTQTRPAKHPLWQGQTEVWNRRLDTDRWQLTGEEHVLWHGAMENVVWSEGPHLIRRGAYVYLFAAEGGTSREHSESVARARRPEGPFIGNNKNPILTHRALGERYPVQNVGHCDVFEFPQGTWHGVCLASREIERLSYFGRETFLFDIIWQDDDWPVFAPGEGRLSSTVLAPRGTAPYAGAYPHANNEADVWHVYRNEDPAFVYPQGDRAHPSVYIDGDDFLAIMPMGQQSAKLEIAQNSTNRIVVEYEASGVATVISIRNGSAAPVWNGAVRYDARPQCPGVIGLRLLSGEVSLIVGGMRYDRNDMLLGTYRRASSPGAVLIGEKQLMSIDAALLSTEVSGGFVGCRVGRVLR